jgi:hypothetical protein
MLTQPRRMIKRWLTGQQTPRPAPQQHETVPLQLTARVVARRIRFHLEGRTSRQELSDWAVSQLVKQDFEHWFDARQAYILREAVARLADRDPAADETAALSRLAAALEQEA